MFYMSTKLYFKQYLIKVLNPQDSILSCGQYDYKVTTAGILWFITISVEGASHRISSELFMGLKSVQ